MNYSEITKETFKTCVNDIDDCVKVEELLNCTKYYYYVESLEQNFLQIDNFY